MEQQRDGLVSIGEVIGGLDGPVKGYRPLWLTPRVTYAITAMG